MSQHIYHRLYIPEPCHEDWNKMTPDEKGAFCKVCNKSVHDFTTKSEEQVASIINEGTAKGEKMCGRFYRWQLGATPDIIIPLSSLPRTLSPFRAFAASVFIVFGTMLFNITNASGQTVEQVKLLPDTNWVEGPAANKKLNQGFEDTLKVDFQNVDTVEWIWGDIEYNESDTIDMQLVNDTTAVDTSGMDSLGLEMPEYEWKFDPGTGTIVCTVDSLTWATLGYTVIVSGGVGMDPIDIESVQIPQSDAGIQKTKGDSLFITDSEHLPVKPLPPSKQEHDQNKNALLEPVPDGGNNDLICYPNPTTGPVNINYTIRQQCDTRLELFDLSGHRLRTLFDIKAHHHGIYHTSFDLSDLSPGTYLFLLYSGDKVTTAQVAIAR